MDPLVRASLLMRRAVRRGYGLALACAFAAYVVAGAAFEPLTSPFGWGPLLVWGLLVSVRLRKRLSDSEDAPALADFELGVLLVVGLEVVLLRVDGGLDGRFSPAVYAFVALSAAFAPPRPGIAVVAFLVVFEAALRFLLLGETDLQAFGTRVGFVVAFAVLNLIFLRAEVARVRATARAKLDAQLERLKEDARRYRLLGAGESTSDDRLTRSSVEEIHQSVHYALDLLRRALDLHAAVLLWLNDAGTHLRISELSTVSDDINDAPFLAGDGVLGAAVAQRTRVLLHNLKPSYKVPYYTGACPVRALALFPLLETVNGAADGGREGAEERPGASPLRGILAIDRTENRPFSPQEEEMATQAARFCLRAIQNERIFVQLERAKVEQGKLYRAAKALGAALSEEDVLEAAVKAAREIASFDLAAVTIFDEKTLTHEVRAAKSAQEDIEDLVGIRFAHNTGLVSMVVQNRYPLPYRGEYDPSHQVVLTKRVPWPKYPSLLVLPLLLHDRALGTLILGARRRHAFGDAVRPTLEVLASHLAVSLSNARMVHKLETMATTDGLTGLLNKRAMLDAAAQKLAAAKRFQRKVAVLVTDIDFFKKVNDTYGHDVGDVVIRGLGDILKRQKRTTDVVARFGGEEFVVLCEQTDEKGAMLLAERIREELKRTTFHTPNGTLHVTCSIGVATFPEAGGDWDALFKAADEALYVSKRSGRDRCTAWRAPRSVAASGRR